MTRAHFACALALLVPGLALAQRDTPPTGGAPEPFDVPARRRLSLPNGMAVSLVQYGNVPKVTLRLVVQAGRVNEAPNQVWLSELTGDLLQEGTTTRSAEEIARAVAGMGGALEITIGPNSTSIGGDVLSEHGPEMARLIADVVRHPRLPASELPRLKADLARELSISKSQPQQIALEKFRSVLYPDHPYGRIFPTEEMLAGYNVEQVRAFHDANVGAARSHLYVVGRFDAAALERAIRASFGDWERGPEPAISVPHPRSARAVHLLDRPGAVQSTIYLGLPVVDPSHPDYIGLQVTDALLGGSFASRITSNIREQKGYTYSPSSSVSARYRDAYWVQTADVTTNVTGPSLKEIFHEVKRLQSEPPPSEELRGIQNFVSGTFVLQNSSRNGIIALLQFVDLHGLGDRYLAEYVKRVHAITPADAQRIARTYLPADKMAIVVVGDRKVIASQVGAFGQVFQ